MTAAKCLEVLLLMSLAICGSVTSEPLTYSINTKKWNHVLDDRFISVTINPTDLLQGKAFGLGMNSTMAILKGLSPAYVRIGSADTGKYTFKRSRHPNDAARKEDEFIVTESHWMVLNEVARSAGLDVIVCLNAAHRNGATRKWDTRNSLELISFSDSQGYNLTFQLGYEVQKTSGISGRQFGKDLNRLRTILNAFPRYQHSKLIGPDIKIVHKKEDVEFINEVLAEAGTSLDAVTWHPRWPQPSKMKVSDISELGYEFPADYIEWDRAQLNRVLQRSILKSPIWIGEPKTESTGTFAEGLLWARRLILAAKLGVEVVMKQPSLMDISHPKPEYWIAFLHKRLLGRSVLESRAMNNNSEVAIAAHCTNPSFWSEKPDKALEGAITIFAVNMGGKEQRVHVKGGWNGKSHVLLQYLLTSGSDPDSVFSQMTYLNGEPLMMTDDGKLPDMFARMRRVERGVAFKLPPYSVGFWVIPEARARVCQIQPTTAPPNAEDASASNGVKGSDKSTHSIRNLNQFIVDKLKNPVSESEEDMYEERMFDDDSLENSEIVPMSGETQVPRSARKVRQITVEDIGQELKQKIREIREMLESKGSVTHERTSYPTETLRAAEEKITSLTEELGAATRMSDQQEEFGRFLSHSGLNQDFGALMMNERLSKLQELRRGASQLMSPAPRLPKVFAPTAEAKIRRFRRSLSHPEDDYEEESGESLSSEEEDDHSDIGSHRKVNHRKRLFRLPQDSDEGGDSAGYPALLKSLQERYKSLFSKPTMQDNKKKNLGEVRRVKTKGATEEKEEEEKKDKQKTNTLGNDLQEEILTKEVEVLQKTEEAMANLIKNHKKRQQSIEEIILHEIIDIKEDRLTALEDIRNRREMVEQGLAGPDDRLLQEGVAPRKIRRNAVDMFQKDEDTPVVPGPKIKRSISTTDAANANSLFDNSPEEAKTKPAKRSLDSPDRPNRKHKTRRIATRADEDDDDSSGERVRGRPRKSRSERLERMKNFIQSRERIRDRNALKRKSRLENRRHKSLASDEELADILGFRTDFFGKSEPPKAAKKEGPPKPEEKAAMEREKSEQENVIAGFGREQSKPVRKDGKEDDANSGNVTGDGGNRGKDGGPRDESQRSKPKAEDSKSIAGQENGGSPRKISPKTRNDVKSKPEYVPLKADKNRGIHVLRRISNLVENMSSKEWSKPKSSSTDVEDLSEEFYGDAISKLMKRRHRRSHHGREVGGGISDAGDDDVGASEPAHEETFSEDAKALRKEAKRRRLLERLSRRLKIAEAEADAEDGEEAKEKDSRERGLKSKLRAKLRAKLSKLMPEEPSGKSEETIPEKGVEGNEGISGQETISKGADKVESSNEEAVQLGEEVATESTAGSAAAPHSDVDAAVREEGVVASAAEIVSSSTALPENGLEDGNTGAQDIPDVAQTSVTTKFDDGVMATTVTSVPPDEDADVSGATQPPGESALDDVLPIIYDIDPYSAKETIPDLDADLYDQRVESDTGTFADLGEMNDGMYPLETEVLVEYAGDDGVNPLESSLREGDVEVDAAEKRSVIPPEARVGKASSYPSQAFFAGNEELVAAKDRQVSKLRRRENRKDPSEERGKGNEDSLASTPAEATKDAEDSEMRLSTRNDDLGGIGNSEKDGEDAGGRGATLSRKRRGILDWRPPSPEERIRNLKRVMQRRHLPFRHRNEIPRPGEGDSFWKVAGSTVRAVFDDVIPEAYGKTKDEIDHLGIAEYFKEFGKIVEQMKNLDRLFANIGQAAVRNYIKGSEDEKGDYIQPVEKKRRSRRDTEEAASDIGVTPEAQKASEDAESQAPETTLPPASADDQEVKIPPTSGPAEKFADEMGADPKADTKAVASSVKQATKNPKSTTKVRAYMKERPNDLIRNIFLMDSNPGIVEVTKSSSTTEATQTMSLEPFHSRYSKAPKRNYLDGKFIKRNDNLYKDMKEASSSSPSAHGAPRDKLVTERGTEAPQIGKFAPWMKTTKDFINQALTTLQRQRELSEMIARESVNDLVKREIERKVVGKREAEASGSGGEASMQTFPVYQVPYSRKREIYGSSGERPRSHLTQLQPGVYIVPTDDMKNLRSEQITREAPAAKPGMPNMVTLNIYYDKKKPREWEEESSREDVDDYGGLDGKVDSTYLAAYTGTSAAAWNPVPVANRPTSEFSPQEHEAPLERKFHPLPLAPMQGMAAFHTEAKFPQSPASLHAHFPEALLPERPMTGARGHAVASRNHEPSYEPPFFHGRDNRYDLQKSDWADFRGRQLTVPEANPFGNNAGIDSGWAVQLQPAKKKMSKARSHLKSVERPPRPVPDKKRSIKNLMTDPKFSDFALPFWKFLMSRKNEREPRVGPRSDGGSIESDSFEDLFAENRKRAKESEAAGKVTTEGKTNGEEKSTSEVPLQTAPDKSRQRREAFLSEQGNRGEPALETEGFDTLPDLDNALPDREPEHHLDPYLAARRWRRSAPGGGAAPEGKPKEQTLKSVNDEDSSLEVPASAKAIPSGARNDSHHDYENGSSGDDALTLFFKRAYDSFAHMMKSMTDLI